MTVLAALALELELSPVQQEHKQTQQLPARLFARQERLYQRRQAAHWRPDHLRQRPLHQRLPLAARRKRLLR